MTVGRGEAEGYRKNEGLINILIYIHNLSKKKRRIKISILWGVGGERSD